MEDREEDRPLDPLINSVEQEEQASPIEVPERLGPDERYRILNRLGAGGSGTTYRAHDELLGREVAIKVIWASDAVGGAMAERVIDEARAAATLNHPGIMQVFDVVEGPWGPFLVSELGPAHSLMDVLEKDGPFDLLRTLEVVRGLVPAVAHAHERGVVHADLKPSNILIASDGSMKIVDFGLAAIACNRVRSGGSLGFSAPECFGFESLTPAADVFSLGILTWHMLTGQRPTTVVLDHIESAAARQVVARAVLERPGDRHPSVEEFLSDLEAAAASPAPARSKTVAGFIPHELFAGVLETLESARSTSKSSLITAEDLDALRDRFEKLEAGRSDVLRVVLGGEFKAGKSTLINALVGSRVAAVDVLEMTSCISELFPSGRAGYCRVELADGCHESLRLSEFLELCAGRELGARFPAGVERVRIGLEKNLPFVLVDTPGSGSTTTANEVTQVQALADADLLLWVVDVNSLGSVRDFVLVDEAMRLQLPLWVVLAQCDVTDYSEDIKEAVEWISAELGVAPANVHPTAALVATRAQDSGEVVREGTGIPRLLSALTSAATRRGAEIRRQAQMAQCGQLASDLLHQLQDVEGEIERHERTVRRLEVELRSIANGVRAAALASLLQGIEQRFLAAHEAKLKSELAGLLRRRGRLSAREVEGVVRRTLPPDYLDQYWCAELQRLNEVVESRWRLDTEQAIPKLSRAFELERSELLQDVEQFVSSGTLAEITIRQVRNRFEDHAQTGLTLAAVATAYSAWLGPAAASISLGAAVTGVGIPLALLGLGVAYVMSHGDQDQRQQADVEARAARIIAGLREQFSDVVARARLEPRVVEINESVIEGILDGYCRSSFGGFDLGSLRALQGTIASHRSQLAALLT